jgi:hypothetical protein
MVVPLVDRLCDGMDVGRRAGSRKGCSQSNDNKIAHYGIQVHRNSLRDGCSHLPVARIVVFTSNLRVPRPSSAWAGLFVRGSGPARE